MTAAKNGTDPADVQVYNLDHAKTPGGMKVRWRVRIATGKEAERLEKLQHQAIVDLLIWADDYITHHAENATPRPGNKPALFPGGSMNCHMNCHTGRVE